MFLGKRKRSARPMAKAASRRSSYQIRPRRREKVLAVGLSREAIHRVSDGLGSESRKTRSWRSKGSKGRARILTNNAQPLPSFLLPCQPLFASQYPSATPSLLHSISALRPTKISNISRVQLSSPWSSEGSSSTFASFLPLPFLPSSIFPSTQPHRFSPLLSALLLNHLTLFRQVYAGSGQFPNLSHSASLFSSLPLSPLLALPQLTSTFPPPSPLF